MHNESHRRAGLVMLLERRGFLKPRRMYEVRTWPSAFPALGHGVNREYCTHPRDLLAQKLSLLVPFLGKM
jgi:hypothetical protein